MQEHELASRKRPERILVCPNAFKGSMTAVEAAREIARGLTTGYQDALGHALAIDSVPLADGGDGTLDTLVAVTGGSFRTMEVMGPLGKTVRARWGRLGGERADTAVIEMAEASGLRLLQLEERDPLHATTYGTGQLMRAAFEQGCSRLIVAIGGSATNDGGAGMAEALGARLLDASGAPIARGGLGLAELARIDTGEMALPAGATVLVACDVDNPLTGPLGASAIYGPQKGATPEMVTMLDAALRHYASVVRASLGVEVEQVAGAGAAGGLGAGLLAFCQATLKPGIDIVMEATEFEKRLEGCSLVVTGEGRIDSQTAHGKVVAGVARRARERGIPVLALAGSIETGTDALLRPEGVSVIMSIMDGPMPLEAAVRDAARLIRDTSERAARLMCLGAFLR